MRARLSALVLSLALAACHEDPEITTVFINVIPDDVAVSAVGGAAESSSSVEGGGGAGGDVRLYARNQLSLGTLTTQPLAPSLPVPPTTGTVPASGALAVDPDPPGNLILSGTYTVSAAGISCDNGDIVVSGTLDVLDPGAGVPTLTISAPNGTVYVTGAINLTNTDGTPSGDAGGTLIVNASRVVVTGSINASGESGGATGGIGGAITLNANSGPCFFTSGTLTTSGGTGTSTGGNAGAVTLTASQQKLHVYGAINASGGAVNGTGAAALGGDGAAVTFWSSAGVDVVGTITAVGGEAVTSGAGATGGDGGDLVMTNAQLDFAPVRLYGRVDLAGGRAVAAGAGGGLNGGTGGSVDVGTSGGIRPLTIETGLGTWNLAGGAGEAQGGAAGLFDGHTPAGELLVKGSFVLRGGDSSGGIGGNGNSFDATCGGRVVFDATVDTSGAGSPGAGGSAAPGDITVRSAVGGVSLAGSLTASAGSSAVAVPQNGGTILVECTGPGHVESSADLVARGGASTAPAGTPLNGGNGGVLDLSVGYSAGSVTLTSGSLIVDGGDSTGTGTAGGGGEIRLTTLTQEITVSGLLQARGGNALETGGTGGLGGLVEILTDTAGLNVGGDFTLAAGSVIDASGGSGTAGGNARAAGAVIVDADANGDNSATADGRISILGSIVARGGAVDGDGGLVVLDGLTATGAHPPATTNVFVEGTPIGTVTVQ